MKLRLYYCTLACLISFTSVAEEEKDIFAVTPQNCGEMTLEKCKIALEWAKQHIEETKARTQARKDNIARMHEEALGMLGESTKKAE